MRCCLLCALALLCRSMMLLSAGASGSRALSDTHVIKLGYKLLL
jgi:hypothetical protein